MIYLDVDTALSEVPVNLMPLLDSTDFSSLEEAVAYNASGMELIWHFLTPAGSYTATVVTPTTGGTYDWAHQDGAMYTIEIPASGGASINNDTEGFGWFTGKATGVLPWRGPTICFRAAGLNDKLIESAYNAHRGLAGTALPDAASGASGGVITQGTGTAQLNVSGGKAPATLAGGDVSGNVPANTTQLAGQTVTAGAGVTFPASVASPTNITAGTITTVTNLTNLPTIPSNWITAAGIASDAFTSDKFASGAFDAVWTVGTRSLTTFGTLVADVATAVWGATTRILTAGTNIVLAKGTGVTGFNDLDAAGIRDAVGMAAADLDTQLEGIADAADAVKVVTDKLDTTLEADDADFKFTSAALVDAPTGGGGDATAANQTTIIAALADIQGTTFDTSTDSLEAIRNRGDSAWTTATGFSTHSAADVWSVGTRTITGGTITTVSDKTGYSISGTITTLDGLDTAQDTQHTATQNAIGALHNFNPASDTVAHVTLVDTCTTNTDMRGTDGAYTGTPPTVEQIDAELTSSHGSGTWQPADVSGLSTFDHTANTVILDATQAAYAPAKAGDAMTLTEAYDAAKTAASQTSVDAINGLVDQLIAALVTASGEPGQGSPPASASAATKLAYLYKWARNKTEQTATERKHYNDAGDTVDQKAAVSDDGTAFTRGEMVSG